MRTFQLGVAVLLATLAAAVVWGDDSYNLQLKNDVASRLSDLKLQKAGYDSVQAGMVLQEAALDAAKQKDPNSAQAEALRHQIEQDKAAAEGYVSKMLGDIQYLQTQWSLVSPADRDYVSSVEKSLN